MSQQEDYEYLDELFTRESLRLTALTRLRGLLLFFSVSLGALALGASLAYMTRGPRPSRARRPLPARALGTVVPRAPRSLASLSRVSPPSPGKTSPGTSSPVAGPEGTAPASAETTPSASGNPADGLPGSGQAPEVPLAEATPQGLTEAGVPVPETTAPAEELPERPGPELQDAIRSHLEALASILTQRYGYQLELPEAPYPRELQIELPRWMNLRYLERLGELALSRADLDPAALSVETDPEEFGAGLLVLSLGPEEAPDFRLDLLKPRASARVCLIVDDVGYGGPSTRLLMNLQAPFNPAILPFYGGSRWAARRGLEQGLETMLHCPMQPKGAEGKYRKNVVVGRHLESQEIQQRIRKALDSMPGLSGVNNHMGSLATESWFVVGEVLPVLRERNLFFVDSVTSSRSVAFKAARKLGVPTIRRTHAFLDNDISYEGVSKAFAGLLSACKPGRTQVAILHDKPDSVRAFRDAIPRFRDQGVEMLFVGELTR